MGRLLAAATFVVAFTLALHVFEVEAVCCAHCIAFCCAVRPCNIFCCNCDTGTYPDEDPCIYYPIGDNCRCFYWPDWPSEANIYVGSKNEHQLWEGHGSSFRPVWTMDMVKVAWQRFNLIDTNRDGVLGVSEAIAYLVTVGGMDTNALMGNTTWWQDMDKDHSGYLDPQEFDSTLA
jgi:hypothetical protein